MNSNEKMDLVVVYLKTVKQKVIVPEYYINGYNQAFLKHLKNKGNNAGRDHLIFWSNEIVEGEFYPDPDQNAKEMTSFPPQKNGWYRGRTLYFTDDLDEAKKVRDRKRNVVPTVYNEARLAELPLPVLVLYPDESSSEEDAATSEIEDFDPLDTSASLSSYFGNESNISTGLDALNVSRNDTETTADRSDNNNDNSDSAADATTASEFGALNVSRNDAEITADSSDDNTDNINTTIDANLSIAIEFDALNVLPNDIDGTANSHTDDTNMSSRLNDTSDAIVATEIESGGSNAPPNSTSSVSTDSAVATAYEETNLLAKRAQASTSSAIQNGPNANSNSLAAAGGLKQNGSNIFTMASNSTVVQVKKEPQFSPMDEEDADVVANIFDGSYEKLNDSDDDILIHRNDYVPAPITDAVEKDKKPYKVKVNDVISANMPFATNEMGDRAYIIVKGKSFKQVCLTKNVIDGLTQYNSSGFRESQKYHLRFIKSLMVGLFGLRKLAAKETDELTIEFIRDLYNIRLGKTVEASEFEKMIAEGIEQVNNRQFY